MRTFSCATHEASLRVGTSRHARSSVASETLPRHRTTSGSGLTKRTGTGSSRSFIHPYEPASAQVNGFAQGQHFVIYPGARALRHAGHGTCIPMRQTEHAGLSVLCMHIKRPDEEVFHVSHQHVQTHLSFGVLVSRLGLPQMTLHLTEQIL